MIETIPQWDVRIVGHGEEDPHDIVLNPANHRRHSDAQTALVTAILGNIGWVTGVIKNKRTGLLIDGEDRVKAARAARVTTVPVTYVDVSPEEELQIMQLLDYSSTLATVEKDQLAKNLAQIGTLPAGPMASALEYMATQYIGKADPLLPEPGAGGDEFSSDEVPIVTRSQVGAIWQLGDHRLLVGDSRVTTDVSRLFAGERARMVWTDPPYGVSYADKNDFLNALDKGNHIQTEIAGDHMDEDETRTLLQYILEAALAVTMPGSTCYIASPAGSLLPHFIRAIGDAGWLFKHSLVWVKNQFVLGRTDYHYRHELVLYGWRPDGGHYWAGDHTPDSVFEVSKPRQSTLVPTMKPLELIMPMIVNSSDPGDIVFDPCGGSGSTLIAANRTARRCFMVELDPANCDVILTRWGAESGQEPVLLSS